MTKSNKRKPEEIEEKELKDEDIKDKTKYAKKR